LLTVAFVGAGAAYFLAPRVTLFHIFGYDYGKSTQLVWKALGAGALVTVMPALTVALKHKADVGMMAATPARTLNAGLLATSLGHLLVLGEYPPPLLYLSSPLPLGFRVWPAGGCHCCVRFPRRWAARGRLLRAAQPRGRAVVLSPAADLAPPAGPVLAKGNGGVMLPPVVGAWVLAMATSMLGLSAPELAELVEEVAAEATKRD
jgi:hypothetical protein